GAAGVAAEFSRGAPAAFIDGLHPEGLGDVGDGLGEAVQGGGAGVEARGEALPPGVEQRVDGVGGAAADFLADFFNRGTFAGAKQCVGGELDVAPGDAAARLAVAGRGWGRLRHVVHNTANVLQVVKHINTNDNDSYRELNWNE